MTDEPAAAPAQTAPPSTDLMPVLPLLDRLVGDVRGALIGLVLGLCTAVLTLSGVIWHNHLASEHAVNEAQDERAADVQVQQAKIDAEQKQEANRLWAALKETTSRYEKDTAEYRAQQAVQVTERVKFEARALAIMERLDKELDEVKGRRR